MNFFILLVSGLCAVAGSYAMYIDEVSLFLILSTVWGGFLMGYQLREGL
jgi:hypothetical protein